MISARNAGRLCPALLLSLGFLLHYAHDLIVVPRAELVCVDSNVHRE